MRRILQIAPICFLLVSLSCVRARPVYVEDEKKTVDQAIQKLIDEFNNENYDSIYDNANEAFKAQNSKESLFPVMKETRQENGKILQVTDKFVKVIGGAPIQVRAVYNMKCEKGERSIWFAFIMGIDGTASLVQVQSFGGYADLSKYQNEESK